MLKRLKSVMSLSMSSIVTVRPLSGLHSWRLTPLNLIALPLKRTSFFTISTCLKPTRQARTSSPAFMTSV